MTALAIIPKSKRRIYRIENTINTKKLDQLFSNSSWINFLRHVKVSLASHRIIEKYISVEILNSLLSSKSIKFWAKKKVQALMHLTQFNSSLLTPKQTSHNLYIYIKKVQRNLYFLLVPIIFKFELDMTHITFSATQKLGENHNNEDDEIKYCKS